MDFKGQKLSEAAAVWIVTVAAILAFLVGYIKQDFCAMMSLFGGSCALAAVATVPDWPVYNRHPVKFLPPKAAPRRGGGGSSGNVAGGVLGRKKKETSWSNLWGMF